jgi:hypothetical protein
MSVTYKNNWNNILHSDWYSEVRSNHFIRVIPVSSTQGDVTKFSEHRTFNMDLNYYILNRKDKQFQKHVLNQTSILEALIHDNPTLTLADSTQAYNVMIGNMTFNVQEDEYEDYLVTGWELSCEHLSNLG